MTEGAREPGQEAGWVSTRALLAQSRGGGLIVPVYIVSVFISYWLEHSAGLWNEENPVENVALLVGFGGFAVVGSLLVVKRPTNLISWIMAAVALMVGIFHTCDTYAAYVVVTRGQPDALAIVGAWIGSWYWYLLLALILVYLPLLFPDGHLLSRRWLPVAVLMGIGTLGHGLLGGTGEHLVRKRSSWLQDRQSDRDRGAGQRRAPTRLWCPRRAPHSSG